MDETHENTSEHVTVAGEQYVRSSDSKITRLSGGRKTRSEFAKHRMRASSSTVFRSSTQTVSTGPSKTT